MVVQRLWVGPVITDITGVALARADRCPPTFSKSSVQMSDVIVTCCHQPVSPSIDRPPNAIFPRIGPSLPPIPPNLLQQNTCGRRTNLHPSHWSADWTNRALEIQFIHDGTAQKYSPRSSTPCRGRISRNGLPVLGPAVSAESPLSGLTHRRCGSSPHHS